jgi:hypothetical protein
LLLGEIIHHGSLPTKKRPFKGLLQKGVFASIEIRQPVNGGNAYHTLYFSPVLLV